MTRRRWLSALLLVLGLLLAPLVAWLALPVPVVPAAASSSPSAAAPPRVAAARTTSRARPRASAAPRPRASVALAPGVELGGVVLDGDGRPVEGATVRCDAEETQTDASGRFRFEPSLAGCEAFATHDEHGRTETVTLDGPRSLAFLGPGSIEGTVADEAGRPVVSFELGVESFRPAVRLDYRHRDTTSVDDERGAFTLSSLRPGTYVLVARAEGLPPARSSPIVVEAGRATRGVRITLSQGARVEGRVTDVTTGAPIAGATIELDVTTGGALGGASSQALSGDDGGFSLEGAPPSGPFSFHVRKEGYRAKMVTGVVAVNGLATADAALTPGQGGSEYGGIGALLQPSSEVVTVARLFPGSPAEAAGMRPGDGIIAIDDLDASSWPLVQVMQHLRGPEGSVVRVRVERDGQLVDLSITRAVVAR